MAEPLGPLLASGRDADIFEHGPGRVLRRARTPRPLEVEGRVMAHVVAHGFPAPAVHEIDGDTLVMDRVEGPTMLDVLGRRPWTMRAQARTLAGLLDRLHRIPAPAWLPPKTDLPDGDVVMHLDVHPGNVILSADGPVLIDWANAARGTADLDVAHSWLILATSDVPDEGVLRIAATIGRRLFLNTLLAGYDRAALSRQLPALAAHRSADRNVTDRERIAITEFVEANLG